MIKHTYRKVRAGFAGTPPGGDTQGLVFASADELKSYLAAAIKAAEPNKTALLKQAMEFVGSQISGLADSDADLEGVLTFILNGWQKGYLPLDSAPKAAPAATPATSPAPAVVAQGARGRKLSYQQIKHQLRLRGCPFPL